MLEERARDVSSAQFVLMLEAAEGNEGRLEYVDGAVYDVAGGPRNRAMLAISVTPSATSSGFDLELRCVGSTTTLGDAYADVVF